MSVSVALKPDVEEGVEEEDTDMDRVGERAGEWGAGEDEWACNDDEGEDEVDLVCREVEEDDDDDDGAMEKWRKKYQEEEAL